MDEAEIQQREFAQRKENKQLKPEEKREDSAEDITFGTWLLWGGTALFFDTTGAIAGSFDFILPSVGTFLEFLNDAFADATFLLWFRLKGHKYSKRTVLGTFIIKFIPLLSLLPEYTLMIVLLYGQEKAKKAMPLLEKATEKKKVA
jgi:hypothetical protein